MTVFNFYLTLFFFAYIFIIYYDDTTCNREQYNVYF
nr:MAG TPA: hypothetical protein [Caudoviricetes sp.]